MDMVGHENIGIDRQCLTLGHIHQHFLEELAVIVTADNRLAIIPPQNDMQRNTFNEIAGELG